MHIYRCYFLDEGDHIRAAEIIHADAASEAIDKARVMLRERPQHRAVEIWEGAQKLYRADGSARSDRAEDRRTMPSGDDDAPVSAHGRNRNAAHRQ
jgi:hypothetical protein